MLHVSKFRYVTGSLDCSTGTEHILAIALQPGMQQQQLRSPAAAHRAGAHFSRQPPTLELGTKRISVHPVPTCLHRPRGGLTSWPDLLFPRCGLPSDTANRTAPRSRLRPGVCAEQHAEAAGIQNLTWFPRPEAHQPDFAPTNNWSQLPCTLCRGPV
jgi:hypothetical protein